MVEINPFNKATIQKVCSLKFAHFGRFCWFSSDPPPLFARTYILFYTSPRPRKLGTPGKKVKVSKTLFEMTKI